MSRNIDKRAICPFFQEEAGCENMPEPMKEVHKRACAKRIRCEGLTRGGKIFLEFESASEKKQHLESFCYDRCWEGCPMAEMLLAGYGIISTKKKERSNEIQQSV
jgi:hypothetical protein